MLLRIHLQNFRKHRDTELRIQHGLNVMRGSNEAGKSTIIEGICYALFGVKALRSSIDECVTHGEPVGSLRATLHIIIDGVEYEVRRGKSGAEVTYGEDGRVTGQTEVTNFLCSKLRVDPVSAAKLMLANQNEIRGALEAGPKATAELIERLAEFDQIDLLIERMQERLSLGNTGHLQERLAQAKTDLEGCQEVEEPDYAAMQAVVERLKAEQGAAQAAAQALEAELSAAQSSLDHAKAAQQAFNQAVATQERARKRFSAQATALEEAKRAANTVYVPARPEEDLRAEVATLEQAEATLKVWKSLQADLNKPETQFEGTCQDIRDEIQVLTAKSKEAAALATDARVRAAQATAQLSHGTCSFCGQDFSDLPEVAKRNAQLQAEIAAATDLAAQKSKEQLEANAEAADLGKHLALAERRESLLKTYGTYLSCPEPQLVPAELVWSAAKVDGDVAGRLAELRKELKDIADAAVAQARAEATYESAKVSYAEAEKDLDAANQAVELAELRPDVEKAESEREGVLSRRRPLEQKASELMVAIRDAEYAIRDAERQHKVALSQRETFAALVKRLEDEIKVTDFNNALLKRVRQCRPLIADQLWNIVLSTVTSYFSEMRGQPSEVTKESDGFKVDGHGVAGLSGSTLDILGLAIRVALVRTFLPNAPFLVLDEPCAAMDSQRTEATLGFIAATGFNQVICATHDSVSTAVADHLLVVGEDAKV